MGDSDGEAFEITDADLKYAMDPHSRRRATKNQQIYGVWADREDSDDDDVDESAHRGFGAGPKNRRGVGKISATPVSFISGGVKPGSGTDKEAAAAAPEAPPAPKPLAQGSDEEEAADDAVIEIVSRQREQRRKGPPKGPPQPMTGFAGLRGPGASQHRKTGDRQGGWERHTKGIGLKLLKKMGFEEGRGLGKDGQGIAIPVEGVRRQGRGAVGAYGKEYKGPSLERLKEGATAAATSPTGSDEEEEDKPLGNWKRTAGRARRPKYRYRTAEELVQEGGGALRRRQAQTGLGGGAGTKVIDMTGKHHKVYDGYDALGAKIQAPKEHSEGAIHRSVFDVPELRHNIDLLVEMTEDAILSGSRQSRHLRDQLVNIRHAKKELQEGIDRERAVISATEQVTQILDDFSQREQRGEVTIEDVGALIQRLRTEFPEEWERWDLSRLALTSALPLIRTAFEGWEPLQDPEHGADLLRQWRTILGDSSAESSGAGGGVNRPLDDMRPYERLVWEAWMPAVRRAVLSSWDVKEPEPLLRLYEAWAELLPGWVRENLLEQLIEPRLQAAVEEWDPLTDRVPIHHWLQPWLGAMGDRLVPLYAPIRHKLAKALSRWHPKDASGREILRPWKGVFSQGSLDAFISAHILPKLEVSVSNMGVNPASQDLDPWKWLVSWSELVSAPLLAGLMQRAFFPAWHEALFTWLSCPSPDFAEVSDWYRGWKAMIPPAVAAIPAVQAQLNQALEMMNQAVSGQGLKRPSSHPLGATPAPAGPGQAGPREPQPKGHHRSVEAAAAKAGAGSVATFRELVERRAAEEGILFMPTKRAQDGKTVCELGPFLVYIDKAVIFMKKDAKTWQPIGLDHVLERVKQAQQMDDED